VLPVTTIPEVLLTIGIGILIAPFLGSYLARVYGGGPSRWDPLLLPIERAVYRILGIEPKAAMTWKQYFRALVAMDGTALVFVFLLLFYQSHLPWNALHAPSMTWDLAFHTATSFTTNTDFQHYAGERAVSLFVAMFGLQVLMFLSPTTGLCVFVALTRGFTRSDGRLGNYYVDLVRTLTRVLIPMTFIGALLFVLAGVPETFHQFVSILPFAGGPPQSLPIGPVATWGSIELIGTNGGGYFAANFAHPFQNPSAVTNFLGVLLMMALPFSLPFAFARMVRRRGEVWPLFGTILILFLIGFATFLYFEGSNPFLPGSVTQNGGYFVGAETRFTIAESSLFQFTSVYTNTGATVMALGSLPPVNQMVLLFGMFLQSTPGGDGTGFAMLMVNVVLAVFMGGLMVGRTPEYLGKKISMPQVKWAAAALLSHPFAVLIPLALAVQFGFARAAIGPFTAHGFTILLYEFTSESANNGSGMAPIQDGTTFYNVGGALIMLIGRYLPILAVLAIAGRMAEQRVSPPGPGTLRTESVTFTFFLTLFLVVVTGLLFLPVLALGPLSQILGGL
jgi:K+-transporting ATPase ATPase A chain